MPSPVSGPGVPFLDEDGTRAAVETWRRLVGGDPGAARALVATVPGDPGQLLRIQLEIVTEGASEALAADLAELTSRAPDYAAAWIVRSLVAERLDQETTALTAAEVAARLWDVPPWSKRPQELREQWLDDRLRQAHALRDEADLEAALAAVRSARELAPEAAGPALLMAQILVELERVAEAEEILVGLGPLPEALRLGAEIAERRGDWLTAMDLWESLPADDPLREESLRRVKLQWRLSVQPPYVHHALASETLSRAEAAVVMVTLAPALEAVEGGSPPVLTDVVDLPMQREILTAVRLDLLEPDPLEPRFHPHQDLTTREARAAVEGLVHVLGWQEPVWCGDDVLPSGCIQLDPPISGPAFAAAILGLAKEDGS